MKRDVSSRISGFYRMPRAERLEALGGTGLLSSASRAHLGEGGGLPIEIAECMSENVVATHALPLSVALNFRVNGVDRFVPMTVEEPSVVAAASNAARMVRQDGGFSGEADPPIMTAQVQLDDVPDPAAAGAAIERDAGRILRLGDAAIPRMVARGGGCRELEARVLDQELGVLVCHVHVDVGEAMGANIVDTVAEAVAPALLELAGGRMGLRILTNLTVRRLVRVRAFVSAESLGGAEVVDGVARASRFAELDPFRAATHNKGFMNGLDAAAMALGQDYRAIEAGAHAYASLSGAYRPLSTWKRERGGLVGEATMPLAVGTVGGCAGAHPGVRAALELLGPASARDVAVVLASVGLASNLAALRALATEGIQKGHMRLHARKHDLAPASTPSSAPASAPASEGLGAPSSPASEAPAALAPAARPAPAEVSGVLP